MREALNVAYSQDDPYNRVSVSTWPIRTYFERGALEEAIINVRLATLEAQGIVNLGARSEALVGLFYITRLYGPEIWKPVLMAFVKSCEPILSWRQVRNFRHAIMVVGDEYPEVVEQVSRLIEHPDLHRVIAKYVGCVRPQ